MGMRGMLWMNASYVVNDERNMLLENCAKSDNMDSKERENDGFSPFVFFLPL